MALHEAREISCAKVVTAPCATSLEVAASLANRFGIIVGTRKWVHQMNATVRGQRHGRVAQRFLPGRADRLSDRSRRDRAASHRSRERAVEEDYAEAIILGCTLEIGFHDRLAQALGVPVIDPSIAALKRAEYAAELKCKCGWKPGRWWSCETLPEAEIAEFGIIGDGDVFGNRVVVAA